MAAVQSGLTNSPFIGINNLHLAELLTDEKTGATYEEVFSFPWLIEVQIEPQNNEATLYADDRAVATANAMTQYNLTFNTATLPLEYKAKLLGHTYDATTGIMTVASTDAAPYFGVAFESTKQNGKKRYVKFYKVQFSEPSETPHTKEESISFNTPTMTAVAIYREDEKVMVQADEEATGYVEATGTGWYTSI